MLLISGLLVALAAVLAYANGGNDVAKGIATLVGSGVSSFRLAVLWGTAWTTMGCLVAAFVTQGLVATFSGNGFLDQPIGTPAFLGAVAVGAAAWVLFASKLGLPVSTTHAIAGALAGAGVVAQGAGALHWSHFGMKVLVPLALSPIVSVALVAAVFPLLSRALARAETYCLCLERRVVLIDGGALALEATPSSAVVAPQEACAASATVATRLPVVDALHWLSAALTSFARGINDAPKIVALGIAASLSIGLPGSSTYVLIAMAMGAGSLIAGFRVTDTLARKVTPMAPADGFAANLVTSALVGAASAFALPVSTTHVSSSAIIGVGLHRGSSTVRWETVREIVVAWVLTLPAAALVGAGTFALLRAFRG